MKFTGGGVLKPGKAGTKLAAGSSNASGSEKRAKPEGLKQVTRKAVLTYRELERMGTAVLRSVGSAPAKNSFDQGTP